MLNKIIHMGILLSSASLRLVVRQGDSPYSAVAAQTGADFIPVFLTYRKTIPLSFPAI